MKRQYHKQIQKPEYNLPDDVTYQILLNLDLKSVDQLCITSQSFYKLCQDDAFWKEKYKVDKLDVTFLNDLDINQAIYKIAYDIIANGKHVYNKMIKHDYYQLMFYLPIFNED